MSRGADSGDAHDVTEARKLNWEIVSKGALLKLAEGRSPWWLVRQHLDAIAAAVNAATPGSYAEVDIPFE
jgi:hypothetical protein